MHLWPTTTNIRRWQNARLALRLRRNLSAYVMHLCPTTMNIRRWQNARLALRLMRNLSAYVTHLCPTTTYIRRWQNARLALRLRRNLSAYVMHLCPTTTYTQRFRQCPTERVMLDKKPVILQLILHKVLPILCMRSVPLSCCLAKYSGRYYV